MEERHVRFQLNRIESIDNIDSGSSGSFCATSAVMSALSRAEQDLIIDDGFQINPALMGAPCMTRSKSSSIQRFPSIGSTYAAHTRQPTQLLKSGKPKFSTLFSSKSASSTLKKY